MMIGANVYGVISRCPRRLQTAAENVKIYRQHDRGDKKIELGALESYTCSAVGDGVARAAQIIYSAADAARVRRVVTRNTSLPIRSISSSSSPSLRPFVRSLGPICLTDRRSARRRRGGAKRRLQSSIDGSCRRRPTTNKTQQSRRTLRPSVRPTGRRLSLWKSRPACLFDRELEYRHLFRVVCGHFDQWSVLLFHSHETDVVFIPSGLPARRALCTASVSSLLRSIVMSIVVCLSVCVFLCVSACLSARVTRKPRGRSAPNFHACCLRP